MEGYNMTSDDRILSEKTEEITGRGCCVWIAQLLGYMMIIKAGRRVFASLTLRCDLSSVITSVPLHY